ncbi:DUF4291 domain-containing protein [Chloroflexia bacterium SDU3-3]|nr:DUF4291 domain-containing protein [Chloroflexia bacterium SDU3-3]
MPSTNQIRADYDAQSITIYQAYGSAIAQAALKAQRFVPPFSLSRMTWIKPSFLWLMERSNWGQKSGQEHILAVRITRAGWDAALEQGVLTSFEPAAHGTSQRWQQQFAQAAVHIQWDPERSLRGADMGCGSIQVGLSRHVIQRYVEEWVLEIRDLTPQVRKIHALLRAGQAEKARRLLPPERTYPVAPKIASWLLIDG